MDGLTLLDTPRFGDSRGFFAEIYNKAREIERGVDCEFVQDNHSVSSLQGTVRGLHFQMPPTAQAKLVRCGKGALFDVAVDLRVGSPTYGQWRGYELTEENGLQLFIPEGFAHGFLALKDSTEIIYKCSDYYNPDAERTISWDDPDLGIEWPLNFDPIISQKDRMGEAFSSFISPFKY